MPIYRKKPTEVEAIQFTGENAEELSEFINKFDRYISFSQGNWNITFDFSNYSLYLQPGDYLYYDEENSGFGVFYSHYFSKFYEEVVENDPV
jgi:hypothetical protein